MRPVITLKFSQAFTVKGNIERVFQLVEQFASDMRFRADRSIKPSLLVLGRGNLAGSLSSFKIEDVKTVLTISFLQQEEEVYIKCYFETRYGRMITRSDESSLKGEVMKLKSLLETELQK